MTVSRAMSTHLFMDPINPSAKIGLTFSEHKVSDGQESVLKQTCKDVTRASMSHGNIKSDFVLVGFGMEISSSSWSWKGVVFTSN